MRKCPYLGGQEHSADDRLCRWRAAPPFCRVHGPSRIRDTQRHLSSATARADVVFERVLQFSHATLDLLPWRVRHTWQLRDQPSRRAGFTRLHQTPSPERRDSLCGRETTGGRRHHDRRVRWNSGARTTLGPTPSRSKTAASKSRKSNKSVVTCCVGDQLLLGHAFDRIHHRWKRKELRHAPAKTERTGKSQGRVLFGRGKIGAAASGRRRGRTRREVRQKAQNCDGHHSFALNRGGTTDLVGVNGAVRARGRLS